MEEVGGVARLAGLRKDERRRIVSLLAACP